MSNVNDQVHYISLTVGDQTYNVDPYYSAQPNWNKSMRLFSWMETRPSSLTTYGSTRPHQPRVIQAADFEALLRFCLNHRALPPARHSDPTASQLTKW
jgi:hypothetical protein